MLLVAKFGGTSVGNIERIKNVAKIITGLVEKGHQIVVVISAMSGVTDKTYKDLCDASTGNKNLKEFDQAMVTGEQISASLLAISLIALNHESLSYNAQNLPVYGNGNYGDGYISYINSEKLKNDLKNKIIPVITGFQGFKKNENSFITLGRGGSDYSAVMIAASLNADKCLIYTDVEGVYTADPRIVKNAIKINELNYDDMIQISSDGAKVLQTKSVIAAKHYNIPIEVLSSLDCYKEGTRITNSAFLYKNYNLKIVSYKTEDLNTTQITTMNLNNEKVHNFLDIKEKLESEKVELLHIGVDQSQKVIITVNSLYRDRSLNIIHEFYNNHSFSL